MAWRNGLSALTILGFLTAGSDRIYTSEARPEKPAVQPAKELFARTGVPAFSLQIESGQMESLRDHPRQWVKASFRAEHLEYHDVAVHIKGSQGSLQSIDARPALTLSFSHFVPGRTFHGLRKIHFNNSAEDPTFLMEILCSDLCREAGLPTARSAHATLTLNGRRLGLYVLKEGLTREFLAQYFSDTTGNLYDGGFRKDINQPLERIGGKGPDSQADRLALVTAAREPDPQQRWERLQKVLDCDRFITLLAMTTIMWNWDGYPMSRNNYRIYHDPTTDKMVFIPHGLDQMFWEPQGTIYPAMRGLVAAAVMGTTEGRRQYRERLALLHKKVFQADALQSRADELIVLITPYRSDAAIQGARLKKHIAARWKSIAQQLGGAEEAPTVEESRSIWRWPFGR